MGNIFKKDSAAVKNDVSTPYTRINKPGVYDVTIVRASVSESKNGATGIDFTFKFAEPETEQTVYGMYIASKNKPEADLPGFNKFNALLEILGINELSEPVPTNVEVTGKDGVKKVVVLNLLSGLAGKKVKARIDVKYDRYNGEIKEKISVGRFYRLKDGASGSEIIANTQFGKQLKTDTEKYCHITYADGVTPELVELSKAAYKDKLKGAKSATLATPAEKTFIKKTKVVESEDGVDAEADSVSETMEIPF